MVYLRPHKIMIPILPKLTEASSRMPDNRPGYHDPDVTVEGLFLFWKEIK